MATTFLLLYSGGRMPEGEDETRQVMGAWEAFLGKYGEAITDAGNPFTPVAKTIRADGSVGDAAGGGPSGYTVLKADSLDAAVKIAQECPVRLGGASISIYETFDVMSMAGASLGHQH